MNFEWYTGIPGLRPRTESRDHRLSTRLSMSTPKQSEKALLISPAFTTKLVSLSADESDALIHFLCRHCTRPEFTYRHHWRVNDLMVWDDCCSLHYNISDYSGDGEVTMNRTSATGAAM